MGFHNKILISGYYGHGNTGDESILFAIAEQLKGHELTVVSLDPTYTHTVQGLRAVDFFDTDAVEREVRRSDLVIIGGGGLFQEFPDLSYYDSRVSRLFHRDKGKVMDFAIVPVIAAVYRKPLFFLSMGIGPFFSDEAKAFYRYVLSLPSGITVRDEYSLAWARELGAEGMTSLSADPAFLLTGAEDGQTGHLLGKYGLTEKQFVILSLRDWIYPSLVEDKIGHVAHALNDFLGTNTLKAAFLPFQKGSRQDHPTEDRRIFYQLIPMLNELVRERVVLIEDDLLLQQLLGFVKNGLFGIGMRYHFLIFSFLSNIPAIALSYDEKCAALMKEMGMADLSLDFFTLDRQSLLSRMQRVAGQVQAYEEIITKNLPQMKVRAASAFAVLQGLFEGREQAIQDDGMASMKTGIDDFHELRKLISHKDSMIRDLSDDLRDRIADIEALRAELSGNERTIREQEELIEEEHRIHQEKERIIQEKERIINELNSRLSQAYSRLNQIYNSKTWRIGQRYGRLFGIEAPWRQRLLRLRSQAIPEIPLPQMHEDTADRGQQLHEFLAHHRDKKELYLIFSPALFQDLGGQRGVRFAQELSHRGKPVIYIRSLQNHIRDEVRRIDDNIIEFPLNWLVPLAMEIISSPVLRETKKIMIFQVTFRGAFGIISSANAWGWVTVYDIIDDWEEFYKENFIAEYDRDTERYVANNADILLAVNKLLQNKFRNFGEISLVPNGYSPDLLKDSPVRKLKKGSITAGFVGHLHHARFDWTLLTSVARKKQDWVFHIIGFGEPAGLSLPENVFMIGPVDPRELAGYAKNWDVAIIPYQRNELCRRLNPIKIFEYLYLGLPIVATGCEDVTNYPCSYFADGEDEFIRYIQEASGRTVDREKIGGLLRESTWKSRVTRFLDVIDNHDGFKKFCIGT